MTEDERKALIQGVLDAYGNRVVIVADRNSPAAVSGMQAWDAQYVIRNTQTGEPFVLIDRATKGPTDLMASIREQLREHVGDV